MKAASILVIDDQESIRMVLKRALEGAGHQITKRRVHRGISRLCLGGDPAGLDPALERAAEEDLQAGQRRRGDLQGAACGVM